MKAETLIYHQKGRAIAMSIILFFTGFVSMIVLAPPASAQSQIPSYYGWAGYNGNFSVYMSTSSSLAANSIKGKRKSKSQISKRRITS